MRRKLTLNREPVRASGLMAVSLQLIALGCAAHTDPAEQQIVLSTSLGSVCDWPQPFGTSDHAGKACPELQGMTEIADIVQDVDADAEIASNGFLQVHEGPVVTLGDTMVIPVKSGFTDVFHEQTTQYGLTAYRWMPSVTALDRQLVHAWDASTDFVTVDAAVCSFGCMTNGYVQEHGIAIANGSVYSPAVSGQFLRYALADGSVQARINPFAGTLIDGDARLTVDNTPMVDDGGNVYYTATAWPLGPNPFGAQPRGSWLVKVFPNNTTKVVDWSPDNTVKLGGTPIANPSVGIPVFADNICEVAFGSRGTPVATGPDSKPQLGLCATQRPALNAPIAYSPVTRHLVAYSYSNNTRAVAFLIEIDADALTPIRAADLRNNDLEYACGVRLDVATFPGCDVITAGGTVNIGNDPDFNGRVHLRTPADIMDEAPSISPDGKFWTIGSYDGGFSFEILFGMDPPGYDARGSAIEFNADGTFAASNQEFDWEVTHSWLPIFPTVMPGTGTSTIGTFPVGYDILQDRGLYSLGHLGVARYDQHFHLKSVGEAPNQPFGDFVDTNIPFGRNGDHYGMDEFGVLYKLNADSQIVDSLKITEPIEVLSGQISRDRAGDLIVSYAGHVHVIQSLGVQPTLPTGALMPLSSPSLAAGRAAKMMASRPIDPPLL